MRTPPVTLNPFCPPSWGRANSQLITVPSGTTPCTDKIISTCTVLYCTILYCTILYLHLPAEGVADPADGCVGPPVLGDHVAVEVLAHDVDTVQLPVNTAKTPIMYVQRFNDTSIPPSIDPLRQLLWKTVPAISIPAPPVSRIGYYDYKLQASGFTLQ